MKQLEFTDHLFIYTDYTQFNIFILFAMVVDDGGLKQACWIKQATRYEIPLGHGYWWTQSLEHWLNVTCHMNSAI